MYKYCQQDSINLLKMNFRKYQKLKLSLSGRFITLHKKLNFFPMLSFSYMHVLSILVTYSKNGLEKSTLEFSSEFSCQLRNLGIHIL